MGIIPNKIKERLLNKGIGVKTLPTNRAYRITSRQELDNAVNNEIFREMPEEVAIPNSKITAKSLNELSLEDVKNWTDKDWDFNYSKAIEENNKDLIQKIRDLHFMAKTPNSNISVRDNKPTVWFHGSPYAGHTTFNSSSFNNTIGGESALGKEKGNFFTTDLHAAINQSEKVYPVYINPGKTYTVDFKGNPWSKSPIEFPSKYYVKEDYMDADLIPTKEHPEGHFIQKSNISELYNNTDKLKQNLESLNLPGKSVKYDGYGNESLYSGYRRWDFELTPKNLIKQYPDYKSRPGYTYSIFEKKISKNY